MTEETAAPPVPPRRRQNGQMVMIRFVWTLLKPFLLVVGVAVGLIYLLRLAGV